MRIADFDHVGWLLISRRFAAQVLIRIRKDAVLTAKDSNRSVYSHQSLPKPRHSSQLMLSTLECAIWVLAQMVALAR